ncbi:unnamed protein product [Candidula unifasciata]|uniref:C2H2-type domain-containing protein n=1 Tax=Candidula unifasciata TaxID=100452 RepID=A0A8S3ZYK3_9EUPU|nr:unnamed protein product [Candidula unifasciata]
MAGTGGTKTFCSVCNLMLNSYDQFVVHQAGKSHQRKVAAGPSAVPTPTAPVTKIVRAKPFIRFVSSQEGGTSESSQNNTEVMNVETGQADSSCPEGTAVFKKNELFCSICVVKLTSQALADMHYAGAKHRRAVSLAGRSGGANVAENIKRKFEEICEVCNVPLISKVVAEAHYAGAKHEKKLRLSQNINTADPCPTFGGSTLQPACIGAPGGQQQKKALTDTFYCHFCKVALNSQMQLDAHYQGTKHKNAVNGIPPQRKKPFTPRPSQETPYTPRPPLLEERFPNPGHHYQAGNFGSPGGFGNSNNFGNPNPQMPFRPMAPSMLYPQY